MLCTGCQSVDLSAYDSGGRLSIPDVGVDVGLYLTGAQEVCDAKDAAVYFRLGNCSVIGDHCTQGFDAIKKCKIGTIAYVNDIAYECVCVMKGHNTGKDLTDKYNVSLTANGDPTTLLCCTCSDLTGKNVWIAQFELKMPNQKG